MLAKSFLKRAILNMPGKQLIYNICRLPALSAAPISMPDARERLQKISPDPQVPYTVPSFEHEQAECDLSIIVPAYNVVLYLRECIESILAQQVHADYEVIIIDDGSTDGTGSIADELDNANRHVHVIHQQNKGHAGAKNTGIDVSRGKWLMFVDSDDRLAPGMINAYLSAVKNSDADYITGLYTVMDEHGVVEKKPAESIRTLGSPWGRLFSRKVWRNIRFPEGYLFEDTVLAFFVRPYYREKTIENAGYLWRRRAGSISHSVTPKAVDTYWIVEKMLADRNAMGLAVDDATRAVTFHQCGYLLRHRCRPLGKDISRAVFLEAASLVKQVCGPNLERYAYSRYQHDIAVALKTANYRLWNVACLFETLIHIP